MRVEPPTTSLLRLILFYRHPGVLDAAPAGRERSLSDWFDELVEEFDCDLALVVVSPYVKVDGCGGCEG